MHDGLPWRAPTEPFELPSNGGYNAVEATYRRVEEENGERILYADVKFTYDVWGPDTDLDCSMHLKESAHTLVKCVPIREAALYELAGLLQDWLHKPRELSVDIGIKFQSFRLRIGPEPRFISSMEKPVARIRLKAPRTFINMHFVVDQSCIRLFRDSIVAWL
ncbi:MAG: hypothetical protein PVJ57_09820 [Phycisphaerae bacterium]